MQAGRSLSSSPTDGDSSFTEPWARKKSYILFLQKVNLLHIFSNKNKITKWCISVFLYQLRDQALFLSEEKNS